MSIGLLEQNILSHAKILNSANQSVVALHANPHYLALALVELNAAGILTDDNRALVATKTHPVSLAKALVELNAAGLLTDENIALVAPKTHPENLAKALVALNTAGILTEENIALVAPKEYPVSLAKALVALNTAGLLTDENITLVAPKEYPGFLAKALADLNAAGLLTDENRTLVARKDFPETLAKALVDLNTAGLLTDENRALVATKQYPAILAKVLVELNAAGLLTDDNRTLIDKSYFPEILAKTLVELNAAGLLTDENRTLVDESQYPESLAKALVELNAAGLLTDENRTLVARKNSPETLAKGLIALNAAGILTEENRTFVAGKNFPEILAKALVELNAAGILTDENRTLVDESDYPGSLAKGLVELNAAGLLTDKNRNPVATSDYPESLAKALVALNAAGLLTDENYAHLDAKDLTGKSIEVLVKLNVYGILNQQNFNVIFEHPETELFLELLCYLDKIAICTQENFDIAARHADIDNLSHALKFLSNKSRLNKDTFAVVTGVINHCYSYSMFYYLDAVCLLTPENRRLVQKHNGSGHLPWLLWFMRRSNILNSNTFTLLIHQPDIKSIMMVLTYLMSSLLLDEEDFINLIISRHQALLSAEAKRLVWDNIPADRLTRDVYAQLLTAAEHPQPLAELARVTNLIIGQVDIAGVLNDAQSTHTASIHRSVSLSAKKLWDIYGGTLSLEAKIHEIKAYVDTLEDLPKYAAAKRCIHRITRPTFTFTDQESDVSILQLLGLAWMAINDDTQRSGSLEEAKNQFIEGLYEIQRGGNLDVHGWDMGQGDSYICTSGTFNKILEKLNGIHPAVEICFVTRNLAAIKLAILVKEQALAYLLSIANPSTSEELQNLTELHDNLKKDGDVELIWPHIQESVKVKLWEEFGSLYSGQDDLEFQGLIDNGCYVHFNNLAPFAEKLASSVVYNEMSQSLSQQGLFASISSHLTDPCPESAKRLKRD